MVTNDSEIRIHGRRLHNALRHAIEDGDGMAGKPEWEDDERPGFEHHASGMYLISILAKLEGRIGRYCWNRSGASNQTLAEFINICPRRTYNELDVSTAKLDALHEIRNAIVHNDGNAGQNRNSESEQLIISANIPGVDLDSSNGKITLISNDSVDFMEWVRVAFLCITEYHGLWGGPTCWNIRDAQLSETK
jgi:hypothetical protein